MRIVSWNVRSGGGSRSRAIADAAAAFDADIIVLSEYRRLAGDLDLQSLLARHGYPGWVDSGPTEKLLGVAIAARRPLTDEKISDPFPPWSGMVGARVDDVLVVGLYSPGSASVVGEKKIKRSWWDGLLDRADLWRDEQCVLVGDFNTGVRGLDERGRTFVASDRFEALSDHGFRDAWRERHGPTARQSSWWSNQHNGFRLDHCFVTETVAVNSAEYERHSGSHLLAVNPEIREDGSALSDHAALVVDVDVRSAAGGFSAQR